MRYVFENQAQGSESPDRLRSQRNGEFLWQSRSVRCETQSCVIRVDRPTRQFGVTKIAHELAQGNNHDTDDVVLVFTDFCHRDNWAIRD